MSETTNFHHHSEHVALHALFITLLPLSPIPFVDLLLESYFARKLFTPLLTHPEQARHFIGKGGSFCLGCLTNLFLYPFVKFIKILRFFLQFNTFVQTYYYWFYKGYLVYQAQQQLPEDLLNNHQIMQQFGTDLDVWLRTSKIVPSLGTNTLSPLSSLETMRTLFTELSNHNTSAIDYLLQDTTPLDSWLSTWVEEHTLSR